MNNVTIREFIQYTSKYLKGDPYLITKHGKPFYSLIPSVATNDKEGVATYNKVATIKPDNTIVATQNTEVYHGHTIVTSLR